jgi:NMT1/THI5 like
MKFDLLYRRRWLLVYVPILLVAALLLWLSYTRWIPQPPRVLTIAVGQASDSSAQLAPRYRQRLADMGIEARILPHTNAKLALDSVLSSPARADIAIASGLQAPAPAEPNSKSSSGAQALAVIEREPVWVFTRIPLMTKLQELRSMRIGIVAEDELAPGIAARLLQHAQLKTSDVQIIKVPRDRMTNELIDGQIDVAILLASASNESARVLMRSPYIQILGVDQIRQLIDQEPRLRPFVLPQGVIELRGDIPPRDLTLLSADLQLVIRPDMHPALQRALLDVATQLHERPSFLQRQGEFPRVTDTDFPPSPTAVAAMRGSKPWLEQLLPYGWAQLVQWLLVACLPILLITIAVLAWIPSWFDWRINAVLQNFYGELKFLETEIEPVASERPIEMKRLLQRLDDIEMQVIQLELPSDYTERWYTLRAHLAGARDHLLGLRSR